MLTLQYIFQIIFLIQPLRSRMIHKSFPNDIFFVNIYQNYCVIVKSNQTLRKRKQLI